MIVLAVHTPPPVLPLASSPSGASAPAPSPGSATAPEPSAARGDGGLTPPPLDDLQAGDLKTAGEVAASEMTPETVASPPGQPVFKSASSTRREEKVTSNVNNLAGDVRKALAQHRGQQPASLRATGSKAADTEVTAVGEVIALVQQRLRERGYDPGTVDGRAGSRTRAAIRELQRSLDRKPDGEIDAVLLQHLGIAGKPVHAFYENEFVSKTVR